MKNVRKLHRADRNSRVFLLATKSDGYPILDITLQYNWQEQLWRKLTAKVFTHGHRYIVFFFTCLYKIRKDHPVIS